MTGTLSRVMELAPSYCELRLSTRARSARPVPLIVRMNPVDIDRIEIVTATTQAMPTTTTSDEPSRWGIARKPIAVTAAICLTAFMIVAALVSRQCVDDRQLSDPPGGIDAAHDGHDQ